MKKTFLIFSILSGLAGSTWAQSSVTAYGLLDIGLNYQKPGSWTTGNELSLSSGIASQSRIGFKGSEDFGSSLKAIFQIEAGIQLDNGQSNQTGTLFNRASWIGLQGDFGTVTMGRQFTPMYNALFALDPFQLGMAGNANNLMNVGGANFVGNALVGGSNLSLENGGGSMEQNSSMHYLSHDWNGFSLEYNYGFGGRSGSHSDGSEVGYTVNYANGPVLLLASYDGINAIDNSGTFKTILVGGSINWAQYGAPLITNIGYQTNKGTDLIGGKQIDTTDLLLGLKIPLGSHEILFSYIHVDNKALDGYTANQLALGYTYALSKRTSFYTSIGEVFNKGGSEYTLGTASSPGYGVKAFDLGMRHSF